MVQRKNRLNQNATSAVNNENICMVQLSFMSCMCRNISVDLLVGLFYLLLKGRISNIITLKRGKLFYTVHLNKRSPNTVLC